VTPIIDAITHQLNWFQIIKVAIRHFDANETTVQIVLSPYDSGKATTQLRNALSRLFRENRVKAGKRFGLYISEPYGFTFADGERVGKFKCITVTQTHSNQRIFRGFVEEALQEVKL